MRRNTLHKSSNHAAYVIDHLDEQLRVLEQDLANIAKAHDAGAFHILHSVPGIGRILALVILYEDVARFSTLGQFASYGRLVKCAKNQPARNRAIRERRSAMRTSPQMGV